MRWFRFALLGLGLLLAGCGQSTQLTETAIVEMVNTSVAQTIEAMPTDTPVPTATETHTPTPTETPTQTLTVSPTSSFTPSVNAVIPVGPTQANICDDSVFVSDVTIPDGTQFSPGAAFTKTWRLRNSGTCTWSADYALVFVNGNRMDVESPSKLTGVTVAPGQTVDISVNMISPTQTGSYIGYWQMQNAEKVVFGQIFYVDIEVVASSITVSPTQTATGIQATLTNTSIPPTATTQPTDTATPSPEP